MKSPLIVNTSRAGIISEKVLIKALTENKISGAALDVLEEIPPSKINPLLNMNNAIVIPHTAFYSEGSIEEMKIRASMEVVRALLGETPENIVNKDCLRN